MLKEIEKVSKLSIYKLSETYSANLNYQINLKYTKKNEKKKKKLC